MVKEMGTLDLLQSSSLSGRRNDISEAAHEKRQPTVCSTSTLRSSFGYGCLTDHAYRDFREQTKLRRFSCAPLQREKVIPGKPNETI